MMLHWAWLIAAFYGGALFGILVVALCWARGHSDEEAAALAELEACDELVMACGHSHRRMRAHSDRIALCTVCGRCYVFSPLPRMRDEHPGDGYEGSTMRMGMRVGCQGALRAMMDESEANGPQAELAELYERIANETIEDIFPPNEWASGEDKADG